MHTPRIYLDVPLTVGAEIELDGQIHHHLVRVLRLNIGRRFVVFNGRGGEYTGALSHIGRKASTAIIDAFVEVDREPPLHIGLLQGVAKGTRMDYLLQKTVELGVSSIQPVLTRYTSISHSGWRRKMAHWQGVIINACEQSGRTRIPDLSSPRPMQECLALDDATLGLVLDPRAEYGLHELPGPSHRLMLLLGPEGGLSVAELEDAQDKGFRAVRLGPRTLRTETAAIAALTAVQLLWGDVR